MIPVREVLDALLELLRSSDLPVGDAGPPPAAPACYAVLELGPGSERLGTLVVPERFLNLRVRVRAVARSADEAVARQATQHLSHQLAVLLLDRSAPLSGEGWEVAGRSHIASSGTIVDGDTTNLVEDYELFCSS